ncbi:MAG: hypothetical protein HWQ38_10430 [Nostoc sp. NMS7]|uniref:hypothetical protein n=1 Tax=uncultured Nostoc sp. TaxID=340711 RepID=UPI0035CB5799|nr:hypothetical protein [Nostoc sp. NMS7]
MFAQRLPLGEATGTTRREVGAAASAVGAARRRHLNFSQGETLRERWKSEFQRYFA